MSKMTRAFEPIMGPVTPMKPRAPKASGYKMLNKGNDRGEIYLYGIIGVDWFGDGVSAKQFASDLKALGAVKTIDLRINSDGGVVTDARAMHTLLMEHPADVITHIDGIAASAASFLAMAGKEILIAEGGFMMIHNARMMAYGEADDMRHAATVLDTVNETIRNTYQKRSGAKLEDIKAWMDAETWWNGKEAVERGFADKVVEDMKVAASLHDPSRFKNLPSCLRPNRAAALAAIDKMKAPLR